MLWLSDALDCTSVVSALRSASASSLRCLGQPAHPQRQEVRPVCRRKEKTLAGDEQRLHVGGRAPPAPRLFGSTMSPNVTDDEHTHTSLSACVPEVYFPARGWMCVDATDPTKGNWLRYVNWARSCEEQNLFPLEINRAIYYKVLRVSHRCSGSKTGLAPSFPKQTLRPCPPTDREVQLNNQSDQ